MSRGRARLRNYNQAIIQATDLTNTLATTPIHARRSAENDAQRLRGIPAIGPNVQGHIPGTRPDTNHHILRIRRLRSMGGHGIPRASKSSTTSLETRNRESG